MSGDDGRSNLQSPSWRLDPIIERRLSMTSAEFVEATEEATKQQQEEDGPTSPVSGLLSPQHDGPSSSVKGQQAESASSSSNIQRLGSQGGSGRFVMYSNEMKARALSYSNIPDLGEGFGGGSSSSFGALTQQQSFSSLNLPGGHVGEMPHSRRETPADGKWIQNLDLTRLFGGIGAYTRDKTDTIDETLGNIATPEGRRGGGGMGHRSRSRRRGRETPPSSKTRKEPLLKSRLGEDDDDDDDDDPDHSFRAALAGIDNKMSPLSSLSPDLDSLRDERSWWLGRLWRKLYFGTKDYNSSSDYVLKGGGSNYESDYLALVPLSDPRLNKRWPLWAFILFMVVISFTVFSGVFFFVQRQVLVNQGEIVT
jgi:hypothetical protein